MKVKGIVKDREKWEKINRKKLFEEKVVYMYKNKVFFYVKIVILIYLNRK